MINVVSLFNGHSGGNIALEERGVTEYKYYSSEVDKFAIKMEKHLYPDNIQLGDVRNIYYKDGILHTDNGEFHIGKVHLLLGGSPCQSFSFSGKRNGMTTIDNIEVTTLEQYLELKEQNFEFEGYSYLFWEYVRIKQEIEAENPDLIFLLENVKMVSKWKLTLNKALGVFPVEINSSLLSAQNRQRLYWLGQKRKSLVIKFIIYDNEDYGKEKRRILQEASRERSTKILGETQERYLSVQDLWENLPEDNKERNYKDLFERMCSNKQKEYRQSEGCREKKEISTRILQKEQGKVKTIPKEPQKDRSWQDADEKSRNEARKKDSENDEKAYLKRDNWYNKKDNKRRYREDNGNENRMQFLQGQGRLNNRSYNAIIERWNKHFRQSSNIMSQMQLIEEQQDNGRVFGLYEYKPEQLGDVATLLGHEISQPKNLGIKLMDIMEDKVDEKYYLSEDKTKSLIESLEANGYNGYNGYKRNYECQGNSYCIDANYHKGTSAGDVGKSRRTHVVEKTGIDKATKATKATKAIDKANCITAREDRGVSNRSGEGTAILEEVKLQQVGMLDIKGNESIRRVDSSNGLSPAITTMQGGNRQPKVVCNTHPSGEGNKVVESCRIVGRNPENPKSRFSGLTTQQMLEIKEDSELSGCLTTVQKDNMLLENMIRIRKLTPVECGRLQTVPEPIIQKMMKSGISESQIYKMFGNGWTIRVIVHLFKNLPKDWINKNSLINH